MRIRTDLFSETSQSVLNHASQILHNLNELGRDLESIASTKAALTDRARNFSPPKNQWLVGKKPGEDNSDPNEHLAVMRKRLGYAVSDFEKVAALLEQKRQVLLQLLG